MVFIDQVHLPVALRLLYTVVFRRVSVIVYVFFSFSEPSCVTNQQTIEMSFSRNVISGVLTRLFRRKSMARESLELNTSQLARVLTVWDLTALGVGSTLGIGIYVLAGTVAKTQAGPAVILSFFVAAVASLLAGLCFAEFGARVPSCGSAYVYCYVTLGEGLAFLMGWNLILEFVLSTSSVARGYSGYVDQLLGNPMRNYFRENLSMGVEFLASYPDLFAFGLVLTLTAILTLGVKESTRFNNIFTLCNLCIVSYVVVCGCFKVDFHNWQIRPEEIIDPNVREKAGSGGFLPFGFKGIIAGAATCFFGFQGFDTIATASEEAQNPRKTIPLAICMCLGIVFVAYSAMAAVLTLIWPYYLQDIDTPIPYAFEQLGWPVARWVVSIGTLFGLSTSLVGALFPLPRIVYAMAEDGLLFKALARINFTTLTPMIATIVSGTAAALFACLFNLQDLVDLMALATLFAFALVAACIIVLRYQPEENITTASESGEVTGLLAGVVQNQIRYVSDSSVESQTMLRQLFVLRGRLPTGSSGKAASWLTVIYVLVALALSLSLSYTADLLVEKETWAVALVGSLTAILVLLLVAIHRLPQSPQQLAFKVPLVPLLPALSIFINAYLMVNMRMVTWVQYSIYMAIGLSVYIVYGWRNSKEETRMQGKYDVNYDVK